MDIADLEIDAVRARVRHLAAEQGMTFRDSGGGKNGIRATLAPSEEGEDVFFVVVQRGGAYLSLSLVLIVDESFFGQHVEEILGVTSRYEASVSLVRDASLAEGEVYLHLSLRIFLPGLTGSVFPLALENLRAAKEALSESFPE